MKKIPGGYYIKARIIQEKKIAKYPPHIREVWDYLLREANHKDKKYGCYEIKRGQLFRSLRQIREDLCWYVGWRKMMYSENQMKHTMKILRKDERITSSKQPAGLLITVCNYDYYQNPKNYESTNESPNESPTKQPTKAPMSNDYNKNDTISKNDKEESKTYSEVISFLNLKTEKNFKTTKGNTKYISARMKEGFTLEDFKNVIDKKVADWTGTQYEKYLRPSTLFNSEKFEGYLNEINFSPQQRAQQIEENLKR